MAHPQRAAPPPTYLVSGTHNITAIYTNTDTNFSNSTSPVMFQVVQSTLKTTAIAASQPDPSVVGRP